MKADPDTERHRLHTAVTGLLDRVTSQRPVMLLLEDTQWADTPTVLLLRHLVRAVGGPLLILATFRETEVKMTDALAQTLADLRRSDDVVRLNLTGLSSDEVIEFIERAGAGRATAEGPALASAISDLTNGNPFLVCEPKPKVASSSLVVRFSPTPRAIGALKPKVATRCPLRFGSQPINEGP